MAAVVKLISKQIGIESVQKWFDIPQSHKIKKAALAPAFPTFITNPW